MRFSTSSALLALPVLAAAQGEQFEQYKAQFQNYVSQFGSQFGSYIPSPNKHDPVQAAEAKAGEMRLNVLTLDNWKDTLYAPVNAEQTTPEEWWVLVTGGNKTCFGKLLYSVCSAGVQIHKYVAKAKYDSLKATAARSKPHSTSLPPSSPSCPTPLMSAT